MSDDGKQGQGVAVSPLGADMEYQCKWTYVVHVENQLATFVKWYVLLCGAVLTSVYGKGDIQIFVEREVPLAFLVFVSILLCLQLLVTKKNYQMYTTRLTVLDGQQPSDERPHDVSGKLVSSFKIRYYIVCSLSSAIAYFFLDELGTHGWLLYTLVTAFFIGLVWLSFGKLVSYR